jgi:hypothetical protein
MYTSVGPGGHWPTEVCIPRGSYDFTFAHVVPAEARASSTAKKLLLFGRIKPYKGMERLLNSPQALEHPEATRHITGRPISPEYGRELKAMVVKTSVKH